MKSDGLRQAPALLRPRGFFIPRGPTRACHVGAPAFFPQQEEAHPPLRPLIRINHRLRRLRRPPRGPQDECRGPHHRPQAHPGHFPHVQQDPLPEPLRQLAPQLPGLAHRLRAGPRPHFVQHDAAALQQGPVFHLRYLLSPDGPARALRIRRLPRAPGRLRGRALTLPRLRAAATRRRY